MSTEATRATARDPEASRIMFVDLRLGCNAQPNKPKQPPLARVGDWLAKHRCWVLGWQWAVVAFYLILVITPALLPLPQMDERILDNLVLFAQFLFWGIWWPFVILSMLVMGRAWCGLFCPEGTLTEWASDHGLGRAVPRWMKWGGWPFTAFVLTTVYGQLVSVYEYPQAALLVLGGSTVAALVVGFIYGKGKRVWCRHLCPVSGVFSLLTRLSPLHFKVDKQRWDAAPNSPQPTLDCAPLIDVRRMTSASECHMCGRCSAHRQAVTLSTRWPGQEISQAQTPASSWDARLLIFGLLGVAFGAFQWSSSPWLVALKMRLAQWTVEQNQLWLLDDNAPWWLLTHYPQANDSFTWLDGGLILTYIAIHAQLVGGWIHLCLRVASKFMNGSADEFNRLALSLTPLGAVSVFIGLSMLTSGQLGGGDWNLEWLAPARFTLLSLAAIWSLTLAWRILPSAKLMPMTLVAMAQMPVLGLWWMQLGVW